MKLLISVRDAEEAMHALAGGADWIDLKEPSNGALGAVSRATASAAVERIAGRCCVSAALGELVAWESTSELLTIPGIEVVKLGTSHCARLDDWQSRWNAAFEICSQHGKQLAGVIYADWEFAGAPRPEAVLECASRAGGKFLLIDTFNKQGLSSRETLGPHQLSRLLQVAREREMSTVLAGSLRATDLPFVVGLPVDIVAIRGAACVGDRSSGLDPLKVREFRRRLRFAVENAQDPNLCLTPRS